MYKKRIYKALPVVDAPSSAKPPNFLPVSIDLCVFCCHFLYIPVFVGFNFAPLSVLIYKESSRFYTWEIPLLCIQWHKGKTWTINRTLNVTQISNVEKSSQSRKQEVKEWPANQICGLWKKNINRSYAWERASYISPYGKGKLHID